MQHVIVKLWPGKFEQQKIRYSFERRGLRWIFEQEAISLPR